MDDETTAPSDLPALLAQADRIAQRRERDLQPFEPPADAEEAAPRAPLDC